jgi:hypothetical protein
MNDDPVNKLPQMLGKPRPLEGRKGEARTVPPDEEAVRASDRTGSLGTLDFVLLNRLREGLNEEEREHE